MLSCKAHVASDVCFSNAVGRTRLFLLSSHIMSQSLWDPEDSDVEGEGQASATAASSQQPAPPGPKGKASATAVSSQQPAPLGPEAEGGAAVQGRERGRSRSPRQRATAAPLRFDTLVPSHRGLHQKPKFAPGSEWWAIPLWNAIEDARLRLPQQSRPILADALCCGMLMEKYGDSMMQAVVHYLRLAECKPAAQKFVMRNHRDVIHHLFEKAESMAVVSEQGMVHCLLCRKPCGGVLQLGQTQRSVDLVRTGLPCQPFTKQRVHSGTGDSGAPQEHRKWSVVFLTFYDYLDNHRPKGWIVEEVMGFLAVDPVSGMSFLELFLQEASRRGYTCRVVKQNANVWADVKRPRLYIFGLSQELGGDAAADWMVKRIDHILDYRKMQRPTPIFKSKGSTNGILDGPRKSQTGKAAHDRSIRAYV